MVCDGVDLKWVTPCLSRQPKGRGCIRRGGEKLLLGFQVIQGDGDSKEITRIVVDRDQFPESSQEIIQELINFSSMSHPA